MKFELLEISIYNHWSSFKIWPVLKYKNVHNHRIQFAFFAIRLAVRVDK